MRKNLISEELMRIQELMGVSVDTSRILSEGPILPTRQLSAFDFNLTPTLRSTLTNEMVDWADNVVGLTKKGAKVSFDDLVEYGKKLAKDAGDDAANNEAKALYYLAMNSGRDNYMSLMQKLIKTNQDLAKQTYRAEVQKIASTQVKDNLTDLLDYVTSKDLSKASKSEIDGLIDDMTALNRTIDADSNIGLSTKKELTDIVDEQIGLLQTATNMSFSSRTKSLPSDIDTGTSPSPSPAPSPATKDWSTIEASVLASTGKKMDVNDPGVAAFKKQFESGVWSETETVNQFVRYIETLKRNASDNTLTEAERKAAQDKLDNIITTSKKIGGGLGQLIETILTVGKKGLTGLTGKKGLFAGIVVLMASIGALYGWDDAAFAIMENFKGGNEACLQDIPGWEDVTLDTGIFDNRTMRNFILSEYPEDKVCEIPGREFTPEQKIKRFNLKEENDIFYVEVVYGGEPECKDTIQMADEKGAVPSFVSKKVCGGSGTTPTPSPGVKTKEDFETWAKLGENYGTMVKSVSGPDSGGIFTVNVVADPVGDPDGDMIQYKWEDNDWKSQ
jgi:hypothetical protein